MVPRRQASVGRVDTALEPSKKSFNRSSAKVVLPFGVADWLMMADDKFSFLAVKLRTWASWVFDVDSTINISIRLHRLTFL